ncbi:MAG: response regulator [Planctomycetota bacterium]
MPRKVLVAEDEALLARSLKTDLDALGMTVLGPASDGRKAIELAKADRPDLALVDLRMPEMDGLQASAVLGGEMGIPIIVISGYSDSEYVETASKNGVYAYLLKPVSVESLRVTIQVAWRRYLDQHGLRGEIDTLNRRLEERKVIERAKGLIMEQLGLSESDAMRRLQKQARDARRPMVELAQSVIDAQDLMGRDG